MDSYLKRFWGVVQQRLGGFADIVSQLAMKITMDIKTGDAVSIRAHFAELVEFGQSIVDLGNAGLKATEPDADGVARLDVAEGIEILQLVERVADEGEDVVTGVDEDDVPDDSWTNDKIKAWLEANGVEFKSDDPKLTLLGHAADFLGD